MDVSVPATGLPTEVSIPLMAVVCVIYTSLVSKAYYRISDTLDYLWVFKRAERNGICHIANCRYLLNASLKAAKNQSYCIFLLTK